MRTKNFLLILCCVVITSFIYITLNSTGEPNDSLKSIVTQTHQQFNKLQENLRVGEQKTLTIDPKYLAILGYTHSPTSKESQYYGYNTIAQHQQNSVANKNQQNPQQQQQQQHNQEQQAPHIVLQQSNEAPPHHLQLQPQTSLDGSHDAAAAAAVASAAGSRITTTPYNGTKANFTIVTYVQEGQAPAAIQLSQNIANKFPSEYLLIYDLGLADDETRTLTAYCNSSKCSVITYDLSVFPSYVADQRMHAFRPIVIKDALMRSKSILFAENYMRIRGTSRDLYDLMSKATSGVLGWSTKLTAVSTHTHPKMFAYFQTDAENFYFMRMVSLDTVFFSDSELVTHKILLPWIKCALTMECIDPIGAQSIGCKYNKKPQFRYSGCHAYDTSAFNIVLGLTWHFDETKYSLPSDGNSLFVKETLEHATKVLENRRRNSSETSEHPYLFTED